ncbi:MAG: hypothetical protein ACTSWN_01925 [Promethearchaeota archaeon]
MAPVVTIEYIIIIAIFILISLFVGAFFLWLGIKAVKGKPGFGRAFVTNLICTLMLFIPFIGCILEWWVIKTRHDVNWGKAILV